MPTLDSTIAPARPTRPDALARLTGTTAGRWLVPSLADLLFVAVFLWLFAAGHDGWQGLLADGDIGWHIRTGEYILDHGCVPKTDLFSFTKPDAPWFAWEWFSDVLFALAHRGAGLKGVVFLAGVVIVLWPLLLLRQALWRGSNAWVALGVTLIGAGAGSMHFLARPHIFTLLFTTITVWLIESDLRVPGRRIWWLVPMTGLWTNLHGGFLVAIALLAMAAGGLAITGEWRPTVRYALLTAASAAASLVNPYGLRLHTHLSVYLRSDWIRNMVEEFQAPTFRSENQFQFEALLIVGLMTATVLFARRRFVQAAWIIVFAHLSLTSVRHAPVFVAVSAPIIAAVVSDLWSATQVRSAPNSPIRILYGLGRDLTCGFGRNTLWVPAFLAGYFAFAGSEKWPRDFPTSHFPVKLIHSNAARLASGRVLTLDQWGDYLIYQFYPQQRVFADGRSDFYGPEIGGEYVKTASADPAWRTTLDRYRVDTVLAPAAWPLSNMLKADTGWRIIDSDAKAILFIKSGAGSNSRGASGLPGTPVKPVFPLPMSTPYG